MDPAGLFKSAIKQEYLHRTSIFREVGKKVTWRDHQGERGLENTNLRVNLRGHHFVSFERSVVNPRSSDNVPKSRPQTAALPKGE